MSAANGRVETWADAFGVWHAAVPITGATRGARQRDAITARRAILAEIAARQTFDPKAVGVTLDHVTNHGTAIYREVLRVR